MTSFDMDVIIATVVACFILQTVIVVMWIGSRLSLTKKEPPTMLSTNQRLVDNTYWLELGGKVRIPMTLHRVEVSDIDEIMRMDMSDLRQAGRPSLQHQQGQ